METACEAISSFGLFRYTDVILRVAHYCDDLTFCALSQCSRPFADALSTPGALRKRERSLQYAPQAWRIAFYTLYEVVQTYAQFTAPHDNTPILNHLVQGVEDLTQWRITLQASGWVGESVDAEKNKVRLILQNSWDNPELFVLMVVISLPNACVASPNNGNFFIFRHGHLRYSNYAHAEAHQRWEPFLSDTFAAEVATADRYPEQVKMMQHLLCSEPCVVLPLCFPLDVHAPSKFFSAVDQWGLQDLEYFVEDLRLSSAEPLPQRLDALLLEGCQTQCLVAWLWDVAERSVLYASPLGTVVDGGFCFHSCLTDYVEHYQVGDCSRIPTADEVARARSHLCIVAAPAPSFSLLYHSSAEWKRNCAALDLDECWWHMYHTVLVEQFGRQQVPIRAIAITLLNGRPVMIAAGVMRHVIALESFQIMEPFVAPLAPAHTRALRRKEYNFQNRQ